MIDDCSIRMNLAQSYIIQFEKIQILFKLKPPFIAEHIKREASIWVGVVERENEIV